MVSRIEYTVGRDPILHVETANGVFRSQITTDECIALNQLIGACRSAEATLRRADEEYDRYIRLLMIIAEQAEEQEPTNGLDHVPK